MKNYRHTFILTYYNYTYIHAYTVTNGTRGIAIGYRSGSHGTEMMRLAEHNNGTAALQDVTQEEVRT